MPFIIYSVLRLALIVVLGVLLYAVGVRDLLLPVLAIVLALMVSYLVLGRQREAAAVYLAGRKQKRDATGERFSPAVAADAAFEDGQVDTVVASQTPADQPAADGEPAATGPDLRKPATGQTTSEQPVADQPADESPAPVRPSDREA